MKYIFTIIAIFCLATICAVLILWPRQSAIPEDTVVIVNGQPLTRKAIREYQTKDSHHGNNEEAISGIITKHLLIAEAQRQGIDKEADFRFALKTFYEHSLIKILMERIEKDLTVQVSEEEVQNYLHAFGKTYTFYTYNTSRDIPIEQIKTMGIRHRQPFNDLAAHIQRTIVSLNPGDSEVVALTGNERLLLYLEAVDGETKIPENLDSSYVKEDLRQAKIETEVNHWIENLRKNASITYTTNQ